MRLPGALEKFKFYVPDAQHLDGTILPLRYNLGKKTGKYEELMVNARNEGLERKRTGKL